MDVEKIAEMAQAVSELDKGERDYFDGLVADATSFARAQDRVAQLRKLPDRDAINFSLMLARRGPLAMNIDIPSVAEALAEAGFVRQASRHRTIDTQEATQRVAEVVKEIEAMARQGRPIENHASLRHWLLSGLDALTGENHSGCATKLPPPAEPIVPKPAWASA